jgi:hypothetical protein
MILDNTMPIAPDMHAEGYHIYHLYAGGVGISVSAKKVTGQVATPYWTFRTFSTFNA